MLCLFICWYQILLWQYECKQNTLSSYSSSLFLSPLFNYFLWSPSSWLLITSLIFIWAETDVPYKYKHICLSAQCRQVVFCYCRHRAHYSLLCIVKALWTRDSLQILRVSSVRTEGNGLIPKIQLSRERGREGRRVQGIERTGSSPDPCLRCSEYFSCICLITPMQQGIRKRCCLCSRSSSVWKYDQAHTDSTACAMQLMLRAQRRFTVTNGFCMLGDTVCWSEMSNCNSFNVPQTST